MIGRKLHFIEDEIYAESFDGGIVTIAKPLPMVGSKDHPSKIVDEYNAGQMALKAYQNFVECDRNLANLLDGLKSALEVANAPF